jgi:hypothetical protein
MFPNKKTTIRLSVSAQANLALILDSVGCNQTAAIENALAVYAAFLQWRNPTQREGIRRHLRHFLRLIFYPT